MMRGMEFLIDRPRCEFPDFTKIILRGRHAVREHKNGWTPRKPDGRRGASDKTGQGTRLAQRRAILKRYGNICHICLARGITDHRAVIDLSLKWPHPRCFTRDHVIPHSKGGTDNIENLFPAHHICNRERGNGPIVAEESEEDQ